MSQFRVVIEGRVLAGFDPTQVRANLARLVRKDELFAARLLGGRPSNVKAGLDRATGERYLETLRGIGVACHLEGDTLEFDAAIVPGNAALGFDQNIVPGRITSQIAAASVHAPAPRRRVDEPQRITPLSRRLGWRTAAVVAAICIVAGGIAYWAHPFDKGSAAAFAQRSATPSSTTARKPTPVTPPAAPPNQVAANDDRPVQSFPVGPVARAAPQASTTEVAELIKRFMTPAHSGQAAADAVAGTESDSPIQWQAPVGDGQRGTVAATLGGKPTAAPNGRAAQWKITKNISGGRISRVALSGVGVNVDLEPALQTGGLTLLPFKCQDVKQMSSYSTYVFEVRAIGRAPAWISVSHSCGSGGCDEELTVFYSPGQAAQVECQPDPDAGMDADASPK